MQIKLAEQLKAFRLRDGRTQEELAQALGVTSQAVSRWERGICYPDMELIPAAAHYFGVTIDELFGYENERVRQIDALVEKIERMNRENNGVDVNMDECVRLAREGLAEFPGNEKLMLTLAAVLYNAGYVRYGEYHMTDADGFDVYDVERHRACTEWREAVKLYEKLLPSMPDGAPRQRAVRELIQLYANLGETERALAAAEACPPMRECRELMLASACDGRRRAEYLALALRELASVGASQMIQCLISLRGKLSPEEAAGVIEGAVGMLYQISPDGDLGLQHHQAALLYLYLSAYRWKNGDHDGAFAALDEALVHGRAHERLAGDAVTVFTSPLLRTLKQNPEGYDDLAPTSLLPEDWPWWCVPDFSDVKAGFGYILQLFVDKIAKPSAFSRFVLDKMTGSLYNTCKWARAFILA